MQEQQSANPEDDGREPEPSPEPQQQSAAAATSSGPKFCPECGIQTDSGKCRNVKCSLYVAPPPKEPTKPKDRVPMGQTVGMAINNACQSLTAQGQQLHPHRVFEIASDLLRVSYNLEAGKLAPVIAEREKAAQATGVPTEHPED